MFTSAQYLTESATTGEIDDLTSQSQTTTQTILFQTSQIFSSFEQTTNNGDINPTISVTTTSTNNGSKLHFN